jgi:membrane protein YdbS with pleckstrin-like domain
MYRSEIDTWILAILIVSVVVSLGAGALVVSLIGSAKAWVLAVLIAAPGSILPVWLVATTYYRIEADHLLIRCGPVEKLVPLSEIKSVTPTNNPLSSPALSLDRLRIEYGQGRAVMISPRDKDDFIRELNAAREGAR